MTKPTIHITNLTTSERYKVVGVNKEAQTIDLLSLDSGIQSTEAVADFSGTNFKVEKVAEPEPITEQEEAYTPSKGLASQPYPFDEPTDQRESNSSPALVDEESKIGLTESHSGAPTQQDVAEEATNVAQYATPLPMIYAALPTITNRREALALSESYKEELKPVLERMKAVKAAVECGLKGEAKKIAYIIQWCEKYLGE